jgi:hypothetical protein
MLDIKRQTEQEEAEIGLLREWLPKISGEYRAYIKGALKALLYAQEGSVDGSLKIMLNRNKEGVTYERI